MTELANSGWLKHIKAVLDTSVAVVQNILEGTHAFFRVYIVDLHGWVAGTLGTILFFYVGPNHGTFFILLVSNVQNIGLYG